METFEGYKWLLSENQRVKMSFLVRDGIRHRLSSSKPLQKKLKWKDVIVWAIIISSSRSWLCKVDFFIKSLPSTLVVMSLWLTLMQHSEHVYVYLGSPQMHFKRNHLLHSEYFIFNSLLTNFTLLSKCIKETLDSGESSEYKYNNRHNFFAKLAVVVESLNVERLTW